MFSFKHWLTLFVSYATMVGVIWGVLEAYTYFQGDHLKYVVGSYWILIYILPIFPSLIITFMSTKNGGRKRNVVIEEEAFSRRIRETVINQQAGDNTVQIGQVSGDIDINR